jgi:AraC-like DNA-binding protein
MTGSQKLDMFLSGGNDPWWITLFYLFYVLVYFMAILKVNKKHRELLTSQFSDQVVDAHLFSNRIILAVIYLLICLPIFMLLDYLPPSFPNKILLQKSIFTLFSMIPTLILIAFFLPKKAALQAVVLPEVQPPSSKSDVIQWESIKQFMDKQQPYLNQDLSLTTLADLLDLSRTQLSALINAQAEKHFYDFINAYRIKYFVERIKQRDHEIYALESLALDSGFKSYTSFYRVFKRTYGMSPRVFIKKEKDRK